MHGIKKKEIFRK